MVDVFCRHYLEVEVDTVFVFDLRHIKKAQGELGTIMWVPSGHGPCRVGHMDDGEYRRVLPVRHPHVDRHEAQDVQK